MLNRKEYKKFLEGNLDRIIRMVVDSLIYKRDKRTEMLELVLIEAHAVLHTRTFNNHEPEDRAAWTILSWPIRVAVEFEFQRLHLVALVLQQLSNHSLDEFIMGEESKAMKRMIA